MQGDHHTTQHRLQTLDLERRYQMLVNLNLNLSAEIKALIVLVVTWAAAPIELSNQRGREGGGLRGRAHSLNP